MKRLLLIEVVLVNKESVRKSSLYRFIIFMCLFFIVYPCAYARETSGILDLRFYSFSKSGPAVLSGPWLFSFNESENRPVSIPHNWRGLVTNKGRTTSFGTAEYKLTILLPPQPQTLKLRIGDIGTSYTLYVNGEEVARCGEPSVDFSSTIARVQPLYIPLDLPGGQIDLLFKVSNFVDSNGGGLWGRILLGENEQIESLRMKSIIKESFNAGIFLIVSLYYLVLFLYRRSEKAMLLFSLICASFFLRQVTSGEKLCFLFFSTSLSWNSVVRLEYLSLYCLAPLYSAFFALLFPDTLLLRFRKVLIAIGIFSSVCVLVLPIHWFIATLQPVQLYWIVLFCVMALLLIRSVKIGALDSVIFLASFGIFALAAINDILLSRLYIPTPSLVMVAQVLFIFFQSLALSRRFAREYRRSSELASVNESLKSLDEAKTRFFTASSHELRTPVTLITTPIEAIMSGHYGSTISYDAPVFKLVKRNCERLKHLADQLLDYLRFDSGSVKPSFRSISIAAFVKNYADLFASDAQRRGILLSCIGKEGSDGHFFAYTDPVLLETVIINLVSNALKNTRTGGSITLSYGSTDSSVFFSVSDTGSGISKEMLPHLFDRFSGVDAFNATTYSGFGIGLPLSYEIVKTLTGDIHVSSQINKGSVFTVTLPRVIEKEKDISKEDEFLPTARYQELLSSPKTEPVYTSTHHKEDAIKVLVVDDDPDMCSFLFETLSTSFFIKIASSGAQALEFLEGGFRPSVIVSDVMMPVMDGFVLREKISEYPEFAAIPFLFLSARVEPADKKIGLKSGAVDYIAKPFNIEELSAKIISLADLATAGRERLEKRLLQALRSDSSESGSAGSPEDWRLRAEDLSLSQKDIEVIAFVIRGMSDKEIASELSCSPRTISNRISALLKKTDTPSRSALISYITQIR